MDSVDVKERIMEILDDKKAIDVNSIEIGKITTVADYFVICTGTSKVHIKSLADELTKKMKEVGVIPYKKEGYETASWVLIDYGDVVVHIFNKEDRGFYNLERLWADGVFSRIN